MLIPGSQPNHLKKKLLVSIPIILFGRLPGDYNVRPGWRPTSLLEPRALLHTLFGSLSLLSEHLTLGRASVPQSTRENRPMLPCQPQSFCLRRSGTEPENLHF